MALGSVFQFLLLSHLLLLLLLLSAAHGNGNHGKCPRSFNCGDSGRISFPFTKAEQRDCGLLVVHGCDDPYPSKRIVELEKNGKPFLELHEVFPQQNMITVFDQDLHNRLLIQGSCEAFNNNISIPTNSPLISFDIKYNITLFRCNHGLINLKPPKGFIKHECPHYDIYHYSELANHTDDQKRFFSACSTVVLPKKDLPDTPVLMSFLAAEMTLEVWLSDDCEKCYNNEGGLCRIDSNNNFHCDKDIFQQQTEHKSKVLKLALGLGTGLFIVLLSILIIWRLLGRHYMRKYAASNVQMQSDAIVRHSNADPESGSVYFGVPLFSYEELQKATNNFECSRELGNGGFGTVYYGKLQDGREVAVKRLYEHNYRRLEQFRNEIQILTRLRHQNLVSLYGCTSRHSQELLLVYEYIPNGTLSCHIHGELANRGSLSWLTRFKIAKETASALAYLHAYDTIHRDVKSNNILLDNNFCVKVADFGLSRRFPIDVTHVSTAPQGTPGYVDPEYHQCYQLSSKSDVYSFGVVLIELISSMAAVDMSRHMDEINLSNLAIKKIQKSELKELVDPCLGFESDSEVRRMIVSVAELAFQCLQRDKELRPSMGEVLEMLRRIESGKEEYKHVEEVDIHGAVGISHSGSMYPPSPPSPDCDETGLLRSIKSLPALNIVANKWHSESTTSNVSSIL